MTIASGPVAGGPVAAEAGGPPPPEVGDITAGLQICVADGQSDLIAPLRIAVGDLANITAGLQIAVGQNVADIVAGLTIAVAETATSITAGLTIAVAPASAYVAGGRWRPVVTIAGVDESVSITGEIDVMAERGAARIAELTLRLAPGTVNLATWVRRPVTIDYARRDSAGNALYPERLFTGVVDTPEYDPVRRLAHLRCTDDLQGIVLSQSRAALDALIGGYWSAAVFDAGADAWQYAQDRLSTVPASLDCDAWRTLRLTPWEADASPYLTIQSVLDGSLRVSLAQASDIVNRIDIEFRYRGPVLKKRVITVGYTYPFDLPEIMIHGYGIPTRQMVGDALRSAGWELAGPISYIPVPPGPLTVNLGGAVQGVWTVDSAVAEELCFGYNALLKRRYSQSVEDVYAITVRNAASIAALGELRQARSGGIEVAFDAGTWERYHEPQDVAGSMYETTGTAEPEPILPDIAEGEVAVRYEGTAGRDDRAAAEAAMQTLIAQAQATIWEAHLHNGITFELPIDARLDLHRTLRLDLAGVGVQAKGRVRRVRHRMDCDAGRATTEVEIALCAAVGLGIVHPETAPMAPDEPAVTPATVPLVTHDQQTHVGRAWYSPPLNDEMFGYFTNLGIGSPDYMAAAPVYPVQYSLRVPGIESESRDNRETFVEAIYDARLVEDEFVVTA